VHRSRHERLIAWLEGFDESAKQQLYAAGSPVGTDGVNTAEYLTTLWEPVQALDGVDALAWVDFQWYLPSDLLAKVDIASMAHGLEVRAPWLDHPLVEFALQLPPTLKVRGRVLKYLLKRAWAQDLPAQTVQRRKQGFAVPLASWLRGSLEDWMRELVTSSSARSRGLLNPQVVGQLVEEHVSARRDWSQQLWTLMMLELWFRVLIDAPRAVEIAC
jgi:asparagine synthase (glutamine-hydrolysing)